MTKALWKEGEVIFKREYEHESYDYENEEPGFDPFLEDFRAFLETKGLLIWDVQDMETYWDVLPSSSTFGKGTGIQKIEVIDKETEQKIFLRRISHSSGSSSVEEVKVVGFEEKRNVAEFV